MIRHLRSLARFADCAILVEYLYSANGLAVFASFEIAIPYESAVQVVLVVFVQLAWLCNSLSSELFFFVGCFIPVFLFGMVPLDMQQINSRRK